jgi:hypothetical protein
MAIDTSVDQTSAPNALTLIDLGVSNLGALGTSAFALMSIKRMALA